MQVEIGNPRITRFLIISSPRSGTMMLTDALDEFSSVTMFNLYAVDTSRPLKTRMRYWRRWCDWQKQETPGITHLGTTMHRVGRGWLDNYAMINPDRFWCEIRDHHERYICLYRENMLRQFLSRKVGIQLRSHDVHRPRVSTPDPIEICPKELEQFVQETMQLQEVIDCNFPDRLTVSYEQLSNHWHDTFLAAQRYLGLPVAQLSPVTIRQESRMLQDAVSNYDQLAKAVESWGRQDWLD